VRRHRRSNCGKRSAFTSTTPVQITQVPNHHLHERLAPRRGIDRHYHGAQLSN
jgi:hypothetical protein